MSGETADLPAPRPESPWTVFLIFLRLGLTAFGGPVAHLAFFRSEFVHKRGWLDDAAYADLVALCQFLPGPASSQVGLALGLARAGYAGAAAAWAGFTLPSALLLIACALGLAHWGGLSAGLLAGLKIVALAVVAQALWGMAQSLCPDWRRRLLALGAAALALTLPGTWGQLLVLATGALVGLAGLSAPVPTAAAGLHCPIPARQGLFWLLLCAALLLALPLLAQYQPAQGWALVAAFFRTGALVFGGGHVALPLLDGAVVASGWLDAPTFLAGYGAAQAVPGPLFTFAAFLGSAIAAPQGAAMATLYGLLALLAIFAPAFLLVAGALPFWQNLRSQPRVRTALAGINAAVVGMLLATLLAALPTPQATPAFAAASVAFLLALLALLRFRLQPWLLVVAGAMSGALLDATTAL